MTRTASVYFPFDTRWSHNAKKSSAKVAIMHALSITVSPTKRLPTEQVWIIFYEAGAAAATTCNDLNIGNNSLKFRKQN